MKKKLIEEQMAKIWGPITFNCVLDDKRPARTVPEASDNNIEVVKTETEDGGGAVLAVAEEIFGA